MKDDPEICRVCELPITDEVYRGNTGMLVTHRICFDIFLAYAKEVLKPGSTERKLLEKY